MDNRCNNIIGFSFTAERKAEKKVALKDEFMSAIFSLDIESIIEKGDAVSVFLDRVCKIEFNIKNENLEGRVNSSLAGPGFHNVALELIENLAKELSLGIDIKDNSGFYQHRDFIRLQCYYVERLTDILLSLASSEEQKLFCWEEENWIPICKENIITPMGAFNAKFIQDIDADKKWEEFAKNYFLWFYLEKEAYYHRNVAIYSLWNDLCLDNIFHESNIALAESIMDEFKEARLLKSDIPIPLSEYAELAKTLNLPAEINEPNLEIQSKIGYCNGLVRVKLPKGWEVILPGKFLDNYTYEEDYPVTFWEKDIQIRFLFAYENDLLEEKASIWNKQIIYHENNDHIYDYIDSFSYVNKGENWRFLKGEVSTGGKFIYIEIEGRSESFEHYVEEIFQNISYAGVVSSWEIYISMKKNM